MKRWKKAVAIIAMSLGAIVVVFALVVASHPSEMRVTRSAMFAAPMDAVFKQINDLHKWDAWSPWKKMDPNATATFEGAPEGVGAIMRWDGNYQVGTGSMTITESRPGELVRMSLDFIRPMEGHDTVEFRFAQEGNKVRVVWSMDGKVNFIGKAFGMFVDCEKMVGTEYEEGLENIRRIVEAKN